MAKSLFINNNLADNKKCQRGYGLIINGSSFVCHGPKSEKYTVFSIHIRIFNAYLMGHNFVIIKFSMLCVYVLPNVAISLK